MRPLFAALVSLAVTAPLSAADVDEFVKQARAALKAGDVESALAAARKAVEVDPKAPAGHFLIGEALAARRKHPEAIAAYTRALELDPKYLIAADRRGGEKFKLGQIQESIDDFNAYLKANPKAEPAHWRRGISFYYAGKYAEGTKQFDDGRVEFGADVENVFWHYLCNARKDGVEAARKNLLALTGRDTRVPFMRVYDLLEGKAKPADVIETARKADLPADAKTEALFYAHLYVGLYYEAQGDEAKCQEHMAQAVDRKIGHYMWDVANVHLARLTKK
ncbi:MAG TPA: tetratricopeptide repeat protein [Gemmataceae bacterium]|nr:tetratricopeptide repeat protein [Gemmataceae bacterium]